MDFSFLSNYYKFFIVGVKNTILLSILAVFLGTILGTILALMKISKNKPLKLVSSAYIEFVRGTPLLVQLYIIYFALPFDFTEITAGAIALSLNSAAYVAEIIRSGIEAIESGQMEAARSLGMSHTMSMRYIIIPQAVKNIIPVLGNEFVTIIKESSIVSVIGATELMYNVDTIRGNTYNAIGPLAVGAILYFVLTFTLSKIVGRIERRMKASDRSI
ncbi:inner membrane amino-acid ABC transporter permease protein YecS [Gottschalkia purinilytica]|uniref:Inner membrane amino-acid ABC transporter permease protein YecS n=1 Tax=Gottschalkia purinilytica TaxID=1503 RepID=A0A0L0WER6_GOTPU|nr:amino acid ABC transporter permease [Gottschalkia purinilytica]KNF09962.1 inner membrane amino-acid ABC transporter permease protein YecS [Gottschalkia purinilytica]